MNNHNVRKKNLQVYLVICGRRWEMSKEFGGKPEEKSSLRRPRHRWKIILKWILRKKGWRV
jgi:hypothetical protein